MLGTLKNIGKTVRNDPFGRVKYHPLIREIDLNDSKKSNSCYEFNIDTATGKIQERGAAAYDSLKILKYDVGGNANPYIIGGLEGMKKLNHYSKCTENLKSLNIKDPFIWKVAGIVMENLELINKFIEDKTNGNVVLNFLIDEKEFWQYSNVMDEVDRAFIENISEFSKINPKYRILNNSLFGFYKTVSKKNYSQSAYFRKDHSFKSMPVTTAELENLLYGIRFHENLKGGKIVGDFYLTYLPEIKNIPFSMLEKATEANLKQYDAAANASRKIERLRKSVAADGVAPKEREEEPMFSKPILLGEDVLTNMKDVRREDINFDLIFKLKGAKSVTDVSLISNINITRIEEVNNRISEARKEVNDKYRYRTPLPAAFRALLKKPKNRDSKEFDSFIFKWIHAIFTNTYYFNPVIERVFIEQIEHAIRNVEENKIKKTYTEYKNHFKFLKFMEDNGRNNYEKILNSNSYKLGKELGDYCRPWGEERSNLVKFIENFNGSISRRIMEMEDVLVYFNQVTERLQRNGVEKIYPGRFLSVFHSFEEEFNVNRFLLGYFEAQYGYRPQNSSNEPETKPEVTLSEN